MIVIDGSGVGVGVGVGVGSGVGVGVGVGVGEPTIFKLITSGRVMDRAVEGVEGGGIRCPYSVTVK